jgi:hypothetical protein
MMPYLCKISSNKGKRIPYFKNNKKTIIATPERKIKSQISPGSIFFEFLVNKKAKT